MCGAFQKDHTLSGILIHRVHVAELKTQTSEHCPNSLSHHQPLSACLGDCNDRVSFLKSLRFFSSLSSRLLFHILSPFKRCLCTYFCGVLNLTILASEAWVLRAVAHGDLGQHYDYELSFSELDRWLFMEAWVPSESLLGGATSARHPERLPA